MRTDIRALALGLAALLALPALAQAREIRSAKPVPKAQARATLAASEGFQARMSRLDALMGGPARTGAVRARSANAEH